MFNLFFHLRAQDKITWHYDGGKLATVINLYEWFSTSEALTVSLKFSPAFSNSLRSKIDGLKAKISRAQVAKKTLDRAYPATAPSDYEPVTHFAELGMRLSYNPENAKDEVTNAAENFNKAKSAAQKFSKGFQWKKAVGLEKIAINHLTML
jgi:hypothetical protein